MQVVRSNTLGGKFYPLLPDKENAVVIRFQIFNLFNFRFLLVDFGKVLCCSASLRKTQRAQLLTVLYMDQSRLYLTFVASFLLSVIHKQ